MNRMLIVFLFLTSVGQAQEVREFYNGSRMMGMGGAGIAVVNDETALLTNPAGLGKLRDFYGTVFDPELETSSNYTALNKVHSISDPLSLDSVRPSVDGSPGTYHHAKASVFPSFVVRNFGIGLYYRKSLDAIGNPGQPNLTANYYDDMALVMGFNLRLFDGRVKLGFNGKFISRIAIENQIVENTSPADLKSLAVEGAGIGTDVGLILAAPWTLLPTISAVVRDVGGTNFNAGSGLRLAVPNRPTKINQDMDVGIAIFPIHANKVRSTFTLEYQKLTAAALDSDKSRYYHGGFEVNFSDLLFVRAGMNQKYWTAGLELASENTQIQLTTYGEDVGTIGSPVEDRRYMFKFAFRF